jgi:hypothetical protein
MRRLSGVLLFAAAALAQPPIKPIPAAGIEVPAADRAELESGLAHLQASIARQTPKLPDYAVIDTTTPPGPRFPGKIVLAGFFNEDWSM